MSTHKFSALLAILLALQGVVPAVAAGTCSVSALDTVAGLGSQVTISNCGTSATVSVLVHGPAGSAHSEQRTLDQSGNATVLIPSKNTQTVGLYQVIAAGQNASFTVIADRADDAHSMLSASPSSVNAGTASPVTVTAILRDRYDNPVAGRPMALLSNRISDDVTARSAQTDGDGRFLWTIRAMEAGQMTLIPYDIMSGRQLKLRADVRVTSGNSFGISAALAQGGDETTDFNAAIIDGFELSLPQGATSVKANELFTMTIRAMQDGSVVRSYIGTLVVESEDPDAELPKKGEDPLSPETGRVDMRSVDQGQRSVPLSFLLKRSGPQVIRVHDKLDPSLKGEITVNVLRGDGSGDENIVILDPKDRSAVKGHTVMLQGRAPSLVNLKVKGGVVEVNGESDEEGVFRISVDLNPNDKEATLFVTSENGTYESLPLHIMVDTEAPVIGTITFDPAEGSTGKPATITVKSEPGLSSVTATLKDAVTTLTETGSSYIGVITAPTEPGIFDVTVKATDSVGNETTMLTKWTVKPGEVPVVTGVTAEAQALSVLLKWKAVEDVDVGEYRVYIANQKDPANFLYSVPTKQPVTSAVIRDLPLGEVYLFSLTAVNTEGQESVEKSKPVAASPIGIRFTATSGQSSLMLEWSTIPSMPLDHYVLEYGTEPGNYPEKRSINGQAASTVLKDLINGVSYELKLTPVAVTGKILSEYAAVTRGTPGGTGFVAGTDDPVPDGVLDPLHSGASLNPPVQHIPSTTGSGIPSMVLGFMLVAAVAAGLLWRSHRKQQLMTQEFLRLMQERYQR